MLDLFLIFVAMVCLRVIFTSNMNPPPKERKKCDLHKWILRNKDTDQEYMVCDICGMLQGGEYYEEREFQDRRHK